MLAGVTNQGCLKRHQIIKAIPDHSDARALPPLPKAAPVAISDTAKLVTEDFVRTLRWHGAPVARNTAGRQRSAPARYEHTRWSGYSGLRFKTFRQRRMGSSTIMERSARNRAASAAGGTAMTERRLRADKFSGPRSGTRRGIVSLALRSAAAGGKRYYAQQDAGRLLPPGGNTGRRCTR